MEKYETINNIGHYAFDAAIILDGTALNCIDDDWSDTRPRIFPVGALCSKKKQLALFRFIPIGILHNCSHLVAILGNQMERKPPCGDTTGVMH